MSLDDFRKTFDRMTAELRAEFSHRLDELAGELTRSVDGERANHEARVGDVRAQAAAELDALRTEAAAERQRLEAEFAATVGEQARLHADALEAARLEAEQQHARLLEDAVHAARMQAAEEHARALDEAVVTARAHAEQEASERLAAALLETEARALDAGFQAGRTAGRDAERADRAAAEKPASERLLEAVRAIDRAASLSDALDGLLAGAGSESSRVAILLVRGDSLRGWRFAGFGLPLDGTSDHELSAADAQAIVEILHAGSSASEDGGRPALSFAPIPEGAARMALQVSIAGERVAILYADRLEQRSDDASWPARLEILARHAASVLESITALKATRLATARPSGPPRRSTGAGTATADGDAELMART